ncbi:MAG: hypothetical protein ACTSQJ_16140, partial [Promethearchaeota archaeon]
ILDIIVRRIIKEKIDENRKCWNILRGVYFIMFFLMQFALLSYAFMFTERACLIILTLIILNITVFIIYLKKYEKSIYKELIE